MFKDPVGRSAWAMIATAVACALPAAAAAQQRIGEAATVQNQVVRVHAGGEVGMSAGAAVFRDETVRTGAGSAARLVFLDQTNLAIGPSSSVVLDRFVFAGDAAGQAVTVNLTRGAFRFTTGVLDRRAYRINTPVATIGVRGTILDIEARANRARVTLNDNGAALVCTRQANPQCAELQQPGDSVVVTPGAILRVRIPNQRFTFQNQCRANPDLCARTQLAEGQQDAPGLDGRGVRAGYLAGGLASVPVALGAVLATRGRSSNFYVPPVTGPGFGQYPYYPETGNGMSSLFTPFSGNPPPYESPGNGNGNGYGYGNGYETAQ